MNCYITFLQVDDHNGTVDDLEAISRPNTPEIIEDIEYLMKKYDVKESQPAISEDLQHERTDESEKADNSISERGQDQAVVGSLGTGAAHDSNSTRMFSFVVIGSV